MYPVDPTHRFNNEEREIYESLLKRIEPTYSAEKLLEKFSREEIYEMIQQANKLPETRRLSKRRERLVVASAISKRKRTRARESDN